METAPTGDAGATQQPDHGYRDNITQIEPYGIDHIPDAERHGKASSQFFIWFAAGLNFPIMLLGFSAASLGLSLSAAIWAIIVGALIGSVAMGVMSRMGVHLGVPQQMQARGPLGFVGNLLPVAYINVFAGVGWAAVTIILGGKALGALIGIPFWVCAVVLAALQLTVAVFGYNMIHYLQRILTFVLFGLFLLVTVVALQRGSSVLDANPSASGYTGATGGWVTLGGHFLAFLIAWLPFASDYSRYLPGTPRVSRNAGIYTAAGNFLTLSWLGITGAILAGTTDSSDPIAALKELTGPWAVPAMLAILLSSFSQNFLNVYGGAISLQTLGLPLRRSTSVTLICLAALGVSLWAADGIYTSFEVFLNLTAYFIAPYVAVLLMDYYAGPRRDRSRLPELYDRGRVLEWGAVAWVVGTLSSVPFWNSSLYTGFVAENHPEWGEVSYYVGFVVGALVYLLTRRLPPLWHRSPGRPAAGAALPAGNTPEAPDDARPGTELTTDRPGPTP
ncbi:MULTISPECIES: cytosine permease [unclassified Streptomyces]|uniref:purine-cytosine permease family protein n=1 Tax=unclassified Streptomyces TaxID=2593676 RepID=UPI002DDC8EC4|nr:MULTISPECIES: cytosine permease [unclassified Streptomyces]WSA90806.1 cytosine permease [Streptomyces sp. NBC_01795]WSB75128.1 cytosine permease [Streptomyces sp. NBC_01775]WSS16589.1 cytosine permease [Streptomyces sp. NBC_01186]WSS45407.1 cytosine permease [Streptomyces sp. NBC_01187]